MESDVGTAAEALWKALIAHVRTTVPTTKTKWRTASEQKSECDHCVGYGGGTLIACCHDKCKMEYHMECAYRVGGFYAESNGDVSFYCENHYKPILFCKCKAAYDLMNSKAMVSCDSCLEWFHNSCVGLSEDLDTSELDYICQSCQTLRQKGGSVSAELRSLNEAKETRSAQSQEATLAIRYLVELSETICPLLDQLNGVVTARGKGKKADVFTLDQMNEAVEYLSNPPFVRNGDGGDVEVNFMGADFLISYWRERLSGLESNYNQWGNQLQSVTEKCNVLASVAPSLQTENLGVVNELVEALSRVASAGEDLCVPHDTQRTPQFAAAASDCFAWYGKCIQQLQLKEKPDNWVDILNTLAMDSTNRLKRLKNLTKTDEDGVFGEFNQGVINLFNIWQTYAEEKLSDVVVFCDDIDAISAATLPEASDEERLTIEYSEYIDLLDRSKALVVEVQQKETLNTFVERTSQLEAAVLSELNKSSMDDSTYEELQSMLAAYFVRLPVATKLEYAGEHLNFLQNFQDLLGNESERVTFEAVDQLRILSADLLTQDDPNAMDTSENVDDAEKTSPLSNALAQQIKVAHEQINQLLRESEEKVGDSASLIDRCEVDNTVLEELRQLRVITREERGLDFIEEATKISARASGVLAAKNRTHESFDTIIALCNKVEEIASDAIAEEFSSLPPLKASLEALYGGLVKEQEESAELWEELYDSITLCEEGRAPTLETYQATLAGAVGSLCSNDDTIQKAQNLLTEAETFMAGCAAKLETITKPTDVAAIADMYETYVTRLPIKADLRAAVRQRYDTISCVSKICERFEMLKGQEAAQSNHALRELRTLKTSLLDLSKHTDLNSIEQSMVAGVQAPFLLLCWTQEVSHLLVSRSDRREAERLVEDAGRLGEAAFSTSQWLRLNGVVLVANDIREHTAGTLEKLAELQQKSNETLRACIGTERPTDAVSLSFGVKTELKTLGAVSTQWLAASQNVHAEIKELLQRESKHNLSQTSIAIQLNDANALLDQLSLAIETLGRISKIIYRDAINTDIARAGSDADSVSVEPMEVRDISTLANSIEFLKAKHATFELVKTIGDFLTDLHASALDWNEVVTLMLPGVGTRRKFRQEARLVKKIYMQAKIDEPISQALRLSGQDKVKDVLNSAAVLQSDIMAFLLTEEPVDEKAALKTPQSEFESDIYNDLCTLTNLHNKAELIPLDVAEFKVVGWLMEVFNWMQSTPLENADPRTYGMTLEAARIRIMKIRKLLYEMPEEISEYLLEVNVQVERQPHAPTPGQKPSCHFNTKANHHLQLSEPMLRHLEKVVGEVETFQKAIRTALTSTNNARVFEELLNTAGSRLVFIESDLRRALEEKVGKSAASKIKNADIVYVDSTTPKELLRQGSDLSADGKGKNKIKVDTSRADPTGAGAAAVPKGHFVQCISLTCQKKAKQNSRYCSDFCAADCAGDVLAALLRYRDVLCDPTRLRDDFKLLFSTMVEADKKAFQTKAVHGISAFNDITNELKRRRYVAMPEDIRPAKDTAMDVSESTENNCKNGDVGAAEGTGETSEVNTSALKDLLIKTEDTQLLAIMNQPTAMNDKREVVPLIPPETKPYSELNAGKGDAAEKPPPPATMSSLLLPTLPSAAANALFGESEVADESGATHGSGGSPRANVPARSPANTNPASTEESMRRTVRTNFENVFLASLLREGAAAATCHAAVVASELEHELFERYRAVSGSSGKKELNRQDYKKHQLMLHRNLKQQHNDQLIQRLVRLEVTVEALLSMSPQELADASTQAIRAKQIDVAHKEMSLRQSVQETLQERMRVAMENNEAWRSKDGGSRANMGMSAETRANTSPEKRRAEEKKPSALALLKSGAVKRQQEAAEAAKAKRQATAGPAKDATAGITIGSMQTDAAASKAAAKEKAAAAADGNAVGAAGKKANLKRPMNVDAGTRYTTDRPRKKRAPGEDSVAEEPVKSGEVTMPAEGLPKAKTPNVLELLKANSQKAGAENKADSRACQVINSSGTHLITITKPNMPAFTCVGATVDRRINGLVTAVANVDGRVKIDQVEKFLNDLLQKTSRKLIVSFRMFASRDQPADSPYHAFCREFTDNQRAGMCNISKEVQLYIIPPALKRSLSLLHNAEEYSDTGRSLYAIVVSREFGPERFVKQSSTVVDMNRPPAPEDLPEYDAAALPTLVKQSSFQGQPSKAAPSSSSSSAAGGSAGSSSATSPIASAAAKRSPFPIAAASSSSSSRPAAAGDGTAATATKQVRNEQGGDDVIRKVARFCAENGASTISILREKPEAPSVMPFLFEGQPGYNTFIGILKDILAGMNVPVGSNPLAPPTPTGSAGVGASASAPAPGGGALPGAPPLPPQGKGQSQGQSQGQGQARPPFPSSSQPQQKFGNAPRGQPFPPRR